MRGEKPGLEGTAVVGYLCHHAVCTCVLLILKDDVGVVVGGELLEALGVPGYFPFVPPAGPQSLLGHVGAELFIGDRDQLPCRPSLSVASTRPAALTHRGEENGAPEEVRHQRGEQHSVPGPLKTPLIGFLLTWVGVPLGNFKVEPTVQDSVRSPKKRPFPARKSGQCAAPVNLSRVLAEIGA